MIIQKSTGPVKPPKPFYAPRRENVPCQRRIIVFIIEETGERRGAGLSPAFRAVPGPAGKRGREKGEYNETGEFWFAPGLSAGERGLRHRHRQCVALSVYHRAVRRGDLRVLLPAVPAADGGAGADDGAGRGPGGPGQRHGGLPGAGEAGQRLAPPWLGVYAGLLSADDVLYHRLRLDAGVFCEVPHRLVRGAGQ